MRPHDGTMQLLAALKLKNVKQGRSQGEAMPKV